MTLPTYREYKNSGVPWLGNVPQHWNVKRFKWLIERNDGGVWGDEPTGEADTIVLRSTEQTVDGRWQLQDPAQRKLTQSEKESALLELGDLLITKSSGSALHIGKTTLVDEQVAALHACYSNFMQRIRVRSTLLPKLVWYILNNELARVQLDLSSNSTTGLANLNGTMVGELLFAIPPPAEQHAIASFLDRETAKIDTLISEQERLIALLGEKRQATISQAVTRGLNPDAPMKDSGVAWLGEVPAHWEIVGLTKYLVSVVDYRGRTPTKVGEGVFLVTAKNIRDGVIDYDASQEYIGSTEYEEVMRRGRPKIGDVLFTTEAPLGQVALVDREDIALAQRIIKFRANPSRLSNAFLKAWIMGSACQFNLEQLATGSTALGIKGSKIGQVRLYVPPLAEQSAIVAFIDSEVSKLDRLSAHADRAITLLKERRGALVAAAVTGQIDVRDAVVVPHTEEAALAA
jgi:type I restriction enzyme S subunit